MDIIIRHEFISGVKGTVISGEVMADLEYEKNT